MKKLVNNIFATALLGSALMSSAAMAEQRIGIVNVDAVFQQMPQTVSVQQSISIEFKDRQAEIERMRNDIGEQINKLRKDAPTMSETQIKSEEARINELRKQFEAKAKPVQEEYQARMKEENDKLIQLLQTSIQAVSTEEKFDMVLDRKMAVYVNPAYDISDKVLKKVSQIK